MSAKPKTFEEAWAEKERMGFQYGPDALEHVRFGWELHELHSAEAIRRDAFEAGRQSAFREVLAKIDVPGGTSAVWLREWLKEKITRG